VVCVFPATGQQNIILGGEKHPGGEHSRDSELSSWKQNVSESGLDFHKNFAISVLEFNLNPAHNGQQDYVLMVIRSARLDLKANVANVQVVVLKKCRLLKCFENRLYLARNDSSLIETCL